MKKAILIMACALISMGCSTYHGRAYQRQAQEALLRMDMLSNISKDCYTADSISSLSTNLSNVTFKPANYNFLQAYYLVVYNGGKYALRVSNADSTGVVRVQLDRKAITWLNDSTFTIQTKIYTTLK